MTLNVGVRTVELSAMTELDPFGAPAGAPSGPALGNGVAGAGEEDPAAAFLAQQESEIAGIENDEAFAILDGGAPGPQPHGEPPGGPGESAVALGCVWGVREKLGATRPGRVSAPCAARAACRAGRLQNRAGRGRAETQAREACSALCPCVRLCVEPPWPSRARVSSSESKEMG